MSGTLASIGGRGGGGGGGGGTPWYLASGVTPTYAYQAMGAASYAASKVNLANPGTGDLTDGSTAPTWDATNGWICGAAGFLQTGYTPATHNVTIMARFSNGGIDFSSGQAYTVIGAYNTDAVGYMAIQPNNNGGFTLANGGYLSIGAYYAWLTSGIAGFAGTATYLMESPAQGSTIPTGNLPSWPMYIGATNYNNTASQNFKGDIQALVIFDGVVLNDAQMKALALAMNAIASVDVTQNTLRSAYVAQNLGCLVCWNTPTFTGLEVSDADQSLNSIWAPTGFNPTQWCSAIAASGAKYATLTTKHHDGFALWPTAYFVPTYAPYSIAGTSWYSGNGSPDIVGQFVTAARAAGLAPGLYYSMWDKTFEARTGTTVTSNPSGYTAMIKSQLNELLSNYGTINNLWFDGWGWQLGYAGVQWEDIYAYIKSIQPNCLIIENAHMHPTPRSQLETYERPVGLDAGIPSGNIRLSEETNTILNTGNWFWHSTSDVPKATGTLQGYIDNAVANSATYQLSAAPNQAGVIPSDQAATWAALTP